MNLKKEALIVISALLIFSAGFMFIHAADEENMIVEANFVGYGEEVIRIEVPDYINLGEVSKSDPFSSKEPKITINNTGNVDVTVTPSLVAGSPTVFNYLFFRTQKTQNGTSYPFTPLNNFNIDIDGDDSDYFYMSLNLTGYDGILASDDLNLSTTVKFTAMES